MSQVQSTTGPALQQEGPFKTFLRATEIDTRMIGMIGALLLIWIGFHVYGAYANGAGNFLTARNLWNLSVQTAAITVMATGMVLIIVTRHIDLSVGAMLGVTAMMMAVLQVWVLPNWLGIGHPAIWIITVIFGLIVGSIIGTFQGYLIAYLEIPSFIVTLGGLLVWRGAAWLVARGETIAPIDENFSLIGGGPYGSIGTTASWVVAVVACVGVAWMLTGARKQRARFGFPMRPTWAEFFIGGVSMLVILAATYVMNSYPWPKGIIKQYAAAHNLDPATLVVGHGWAIPVLIALAVVLAMTFMTTRTKFGRYVFAMGGNPEAADLAGINTRRLTMLIFTLMGFLVGIAAAISSARLKAATADLGRNDELYVIAAAVIGGTSLAGGSGTIYGAMIGALVMQSLYSGMVLVGFDAAIQNMVVGGVLVLAVYVDTVYRRHAK
ncbi:MULTISPECIES: sugar ABC transporter permease [unclassified Rhizobium]|jgi:D-xylose transport system permease protein|uniref:sugar ABC transporter permease n=1 Tax=unclassified Rhizobium TaxID=2613769 RepID=UPI0021E7FA16|nr:MULTISPECIES: sugar ABC transporter permease [unclassified Rhizobium]MCV3766154.1 sugar ABC transporter permease [Rhizobium sp. TRM95796]MDH6269532.1 D-xylose transport system permease protein [Rhizobium sp. SG_E_25_P2]